MIPHREGDCKRGAGRGLSGDLERDGGDGGRKFCRQRRRAGEKWRCETGKGNSGCNKGR